jgi:putative DNA primase/helicase
MSVASAAKAGVYSAAYIAERLDGRRSGQGYSAHCPAHDDRRASLSICEKGGRVLFKCHAGCSQGNVINALRRRGLWLDEDSRRPAQRAVIYYDYRNEAGNTIYRICRTANKKFFAEHLEGRWWNKGIGNRRVLYHLNELVNRPAEPVWIAEGEKDLYFVR